MLPRPLLNLVMVDPEGVSFSFVDVMDEARR